MGVGASGRGSVSGLAASMDPYLVELLTSLLKVVAVVTLISWSGLGTGFNSEVEVKLENSCMPVLDCFLKLCTTYMDMIRENKEMRKTPKSRER